MRIKRPGEQRSASRSATRALDVLELFGRLHRPLRAVEIARALELHASTTNQLLKTMVESAHLIFAAPSKTYFPSPRLVRFGVWLLSVYGDDERLRRMVRQVRAVSSAVVTLTTPNDLFMQVLDLEGTSDDADGTGAERGLRVSIFGSAIGAAYLSTLPPGELARLIDRARLNTDAAVSVRAWLGRVRADGFADGPSPDLRQWSIAIPVTGVDDAVPLVLGLAGPMERIRNERERLGSLLRDTVALFGDAPDRPVPSL